MDNCQYSFVRGFASLMNHVLNFNQEVSRTPQGLGLDLSPPEGIEQELSGSASSDNINTVLMFFAFLMILGYYIQRYISNRSGSPSGSLL